MGDIIKQLEELLSRYEITAPIEWNTDKPTRDGSQWLIGHRWTYQGKDFYWCCFGDYKKGLRETWDSYSGDELSPDEKKAATKHKSDIVKKEKVALEAEWERVADKCASEFEKDSPTGSTPYLNRKLVRSLYGARIRTQSNGHDPIIIVPLRDIHGRLWNYQRIYAQKLSAGDKFFADGGRIEGLCHILQPEGTSKLAQEASPMVGSDRPHSDGERESDDGGTYFDAGFIAQGPTESDDRPNAGVNDNRRMLERRLEEVGTDSQSIYICEGFATAASVQAALPNAVVLCAFNANNLLPVASAVRGVYPSHRIIVCGDNDQFTVVNGKPDNVGLRKARSTAGTVSGSVVWPIFKVQTKGFTDFNDLEAAEGLDTVRDQILNHAKYLTGVQPMNLAVSKSGKVVPPTEKQVTEYMLSYFAGKIIAQDKSLFRYTGTHWQELGVKGINQIKQALNVAANGLLDSRDIENYYRFLVIHTPHVPTGVDFYKPNPYAANFSNGTLQLTPEKQLVFGPHQVDHYLTNVLPFAYNDLPDLPPAPLFDAMVERLWGSHQEREEVKALAWELLGACFMPVAPVIAIFYGSPGTGKSTFIKLLIKLVAQENVSNVQLCDMHGFNMESMVGKLINHDTDIDVNKPMNDSEVKKLIDRMPRRVRRKGIADVYGYLPAVHLFAANRLPKSLDGSSHAYGRRLVLIKTDAVIQGKTSFDFEERILRDELPGLIARGRIGLERLSKNEGQFTIPAASRLAVAELEMESDLVGQFIQEIKEGEVRDPKSHALTINENARIERAVIWETFCRWFEEAHIGSQKLSFGKVQFYATLEERGFKVVTTKGVRRFSGLGLVVSDSSIG